MVDSNLFRNGVPVYKGAFLLKATKDKLEAIIVPQQDVSVDQINLEKLHIEMQGQGVVFGLLPALEENQAGDIVAARGTSAQNGEDAKVVLRVKPATFHPPEAQLDKERVDFKELHNIVNVKEGTVLAEKIPPTSGVVGKDVFGGEIAPKPGKDRNLKGGGGVAVSGEGDKLTAEKDGKFVVIDRKPTVMTDHVVMGNVDFSVGNIVFGGKSLVIHGEVLPGFSVKCRGNIEIQNGINNAEVIAGGNLVVKKNIVGEEAVIKARGDIVADFIENGPGIECDGSLNVKNYIYQSRVTVGKDLHVHGDGAVVGGSYVVGGSMYVKHLGSDAGINTEVYVGLDLNVKNKKDKCEEEHALWSGRLNDVIKGISTFEKQKKEGALSPEMAEKLKKFTTVMPKLMEKVDTLQETSQQLQEELDQMVNEGVYVANTIYPGALIKIGKAVKSVTAPEYGVVAVIDHSSLQIVLRKLTDKERQKTEQ